ncbi:MAG: phosphoribosylaminoimidazolesuccinocarboxamide synthase [Clostridiales bacterium]|nr:MAG: phosphoribosylaminoimidazolesuccinocarboxamide synthase [Clostridiales bacterium]
MSKMLYEGKAKIIFSTEQADQYRVYFKDDATAFNGSKRATIAGKGVLNNKISAKIFEILEQFGVKTHYIKTLSDNEMLVKKVDIIPLEVIMRNIAAGSFCKRYGAVEGTALNMSTLEYSYKNDALNDPLINDDHIVALGIASREELAVIADSARRINQIMSDFWREKGILLVDFKLEFGYHNGEIILADEVSPDTCRLWDEATRQKLDKDLFRRDLGDLVENYREVLSRMER